MKPEADPSLIEAHRLCARLRHYNGDLSEDPEAWLKIAELFDLGVHRVLGYTDWTQFFKHEFGKSRTIAQGLLGAGRVVRAILDLMPPGSQLPNKTQAIQVISHAGGSQDPAALVAAWKEMIGIEESGLLVPVTSEPLSRKARMNAEAERRRFYAALSSVGGYVDGLVDAKYARIQSVATAEDVAAWDRLIRDAIHGLRRVRSSLEEER